MEQIRGLELSTGKLYVQFTPGADDIELIAVDIIAGHAIGLILSTLQDVPPLIEALQEAIKDKK